ncbi:MAG: hypothetical protein FWD57_04245 [Polyangiaceae bacterium]|nr:hypothetical protein [Polyangiaceae bacterium]
MKRVICVVGIVVAVAVVACSVPQEADDSVGQQVQAVESAPEEKGVEEGPGLAPDPLVVPYEDHHKPGEVDGPSPSPVPEITIEERMALPNWPQQLAEKQAYADQLIANAVGEPVPMPPVDPSVIARQQRFLELVAERQAEFDALDPETREEVYAEFKMKELGR